MANLSALTEGQSRFLRRLADKSVSRECFTWRLFRNELICATDPQGSRMQDVPTDLVFYQALDSLRFIKVREMPSHRVFYEQETLEIEVLQQTADYGRLCAEGGNVTVSRVISEQRKRFTYLRALYDSTGPTELATVERKKFGVSLGFSRDEIDRIEQYLEGDGLLVHRTLRHVSITHAGIVQIERALTRPDQATEYFPPVVNIINAQQIIGSQLQQGTVQSQQSGILKSMEPDDLRAIVAELRDKIAEMSLNGEAGAEAESELRTLEAQAESPRPKRVIIEAAAQALLDILKAVGIAAIPKVLERLAITGSGLL